MAAVSYRLDHLAVSCTALEAGAAWVEAALGVRLAEAIGMHPHMGTQNRLLGLGPDLYMEVIAIDPAAPPPAQPRWFDLDRFAGPPRPTHWILRTSDLDRAVAAAPAGIGVPKALTRGAYAWRFAIPPDGVLPCADAHPALIEWRGAAHPARDLPDAGCRLRRLEVTTPEAGALRRALAGRLDDPRVSVLQGPVKALRLEILTPQGPRWLA